ALGELVQAGLIIARGQPPDAVYTFKHALVQDAAYASLLRDRRRAIHLRVAEILESDAAGGASELQLVAWHFAEAGLPDKSIEYYEKAANRATGRFALAEMVSHLRNGLAQVERLPDSPGRQKRELDLEVALGRALIDHQGSGAEEVRTAFERARELCLMLDDTKQLIRVHDGLFNHHVTHSEPHVILRYANELHEMGQRTGDQQAFLMARRSAGYANLLLGRFAEARDEMQSLLITYDADRDGPHSGLTTRDQKVSSCTLRGIGLAAMGHPAGGAAASDEGVRHAETLDHVVSLILGLRRACVQCMMQRDTQGVITLSDRLLATEYETFTGTREGMFFRSWA